MGNKPKMVYIALYKGKKLEVEAASLLQARDKAAELFKAKKPWEIAIMLAEKDGKPVVHTPDF